MGKIWTGKLPSSSDRGLHAEHAGEPWSWAGPLVWARRSLLALIEDILLVFLQVSFGFLDAGCQVTPPIGSADTQGKALLLKDLLNSSIKAL
jgi:hypothetical protein